MVMALKPLAWMIGGSLAAWAIVTALGGSRVHPELLFGMAAPLVGAAVSWRVFERTHTAAPERLPSVMITAFAIKFVFFGAYVVMMLGVLSLRPWPFVMSFTGFYIALHLSEALFLRALTTRGWNLGTENPEPRT
jgi:uncharacterized membrane protein AbrB (regulator of aidB expression)